MILWESEFSADDEFYFGDQEEMGLGVRVATPISVRDGRGAITNSDGLKNERQVWGKQAEWCDYAGTVDGKPVGITIMPDPHHFRRSWFHARDYGFVACNPFGRNAFTGNEKSRVVIRPRESMKLRFGVLLHGAETDKAPSSLDAAYRDFLSVLGAGAPGK